LQTPVKYGFFKIMSIRKRKLQSEYFVEVACFGEAEKMVTSKYLRGMGVTGPAEAQMPP
jgi:hypothetical protein